MFFTWMEGNGNLIANNAGNINSNREQVDDEVRGDARQQMTVLEDQFAETNIIDPASPVNNELREEATEPITGFAEEVICTDTSQENFVDGPRRVSEGDVQQFPDKQRRPREFAHREQRLFERETPEPESDDNNIEKITKKTKDNKPVEKGSETSSTSRRTGDKLKAKAQPKFDFLKVPPATQRRDAHPDAEDNKALVNKRNIRQLDS